MQTHKMDHMLFANVIKSFFLQKNFTKNSCRYLVKCLTKTVNPLKIMKFVVNFKKNLLSPVGSNPFRKIPKAKI